MPGRVFQQGFQRPQPVDDLPFLRPKAREDLTRRVLRGFGVDDFLIAVEREFVAMRGKVGRGYTKALGGAVRNGACYKCLNCGESLGCS